MKFIPLPFRMLDLLAGLARLLTGTQGVWRGVLPDKTQRVYFANHTSNLDTIIIWSALPTELRKITRPVAAKDYWDQPGLRRHIATKELNVVFVERNAEGRTQDPLNPLRQALDNGDSLIIFPEGKRNAEVLPGKFRSGLFTLYEEYPNVEFVPVYLENVSKTFPRGAFFPLPIICKAHFGYRFKVEENEYLEEKKERIGNFLSQARQAVIKLIPEHIKASVPDFNEKVTNPEVNK